MKQLSGVDASFLYMETATSFGHVSGLAVFRRPDLEGWSPYDALLARMSHRLPDLEPLRRRVIEVPLSLDHPYWIEDPAFDLEFHIREAALPSPGTNEQLADLAARIIGRPLDRSHPLWEAYVIEGLVGDRFAIMTKLHHATIDGAAGAELMKIMFDSVKDAAPAEVAAKLPPTESVPSAPKVLARALGDIARKPEKFVRLQVRTLRALGELTRNRGLTGLADLARRPNFLSSRRPGESGDPDRAEAPPRTAAPATPLNGSITAHRRVALRNLSMVDIKSIKSATGATVNDVVMALCAGALRRYLEEHDALPAVPLVSMVPVSIRTGAEKDRWTNRVSSLFPPIPTDEPDPVKRLDRVHAAMNDAKARFALLPADVITDYAQFAPPALAIRAARVATRLRIADRTNPPFNLVISNVPGPRSTLYLEGAELEHYYPISTISESQGLNITLQSYGDLLDVAMVACRELVPDVDHLADLLVEEVAILGAAVIPAGTRRAPSKKASAAKKAAAAS